MSEEKGSKKKDKKKKGQESAFPTDKRGGFDPGKTQVREGAAAAGHKGIETLDQALELEREKRKAAERRLETAESHNASLVGQLGEEPRRVFDENVRYREKNTALQTEIELYHAKPPRC